MGPTSILAFHLSTLTLGGLPVDAAAGGRAEVTGGRIPANPAAPSSGTFTTELVPAGALRFAGRRSSLRLRYAPRIFWRYPVVTGIERPLVLHAGDLAYGNDLTPSLRLDADATASIGELDFIGTTMVFAPTQATVVEATVLEFATVRGGIALSADLSPRTTIVTRITADHSTPIGDSAELEMIPAPGTPDDAEPGMPFPAWTSVTASMQYEHTLARRDTLLLPAVVSEHRLSTGIRFLSVRSALGWRREVDRTTTFELVGGAEYFMPRGAAARGASVLPVAGAAIEHVIDNRRNQRLVGRLGARTEGLLDPVRSDYRPVVGLEAALELRLPPRWAVGARGTFFTAATREPLGAGEVETIGAVSTPVTYTISSSAQLEFGTRMMVLAPHFRGEALPFDQLQLLGYVALSLAFGTDHGPPTWVF